MIKCYSREKIQEEKWNDCVNKAHNAALYGQTTYLDAIAPNWVGLVLSDYEAVMPLVYKTKWGLSYICQTDFIQRVAIYSAEPLATDQIRAFYKAIPLKFVLRDLNVDEYSVLPEYKNSPRLNLLLDLNKPYDALKADYRSNTKRNLKKALAGSLELREEKGGEKIVEAFRTYRVVKANLEMQQSSFDRIKKLMTESVKNKTGKIYAAYEDGVFLGAVFFAFGPKRDYYLFSGVTEMGTEKRALFFLVDQYLLHNQNRHHILDFEGSMDPGVARFYAGFGAKEENYYHLRHTIFKAAFSF